MSRSEEGRSRVTDVFASRQEPVEHGGRVVGRSAQRRHRTGQMGQTPNPSPCWTGEAWGGQSMGGDRSRGRETAGQGRWPDAGG